MAGFASDDLVITGATIEALAAHTDDPPVWVVTVSPVSSYTGEAVLMIAAGAVSDEARTPNEAVSATFTVDTEAPRFESAQIK